VRRIWIIDRGKALLNISIAPSATAGLVTVTAATGIQAVTLNAGLQIRPAATQQTSLRAPVLNLATGLPGLPTGGTAVISATGLPASLTGWTLTMNDAKVDFALDSDSKKLRAVVPGGTPLGPVVLRLISPSGDPIPPILFHVDAQPPVIQNAFRGSVFVDALHPAAAGDVMSVDVARLYGSAPSVSPSSVHVSVGGVDHLATALSPVLQFGLVSDVVRVQFTLASGLPDGTQQPMTVRVGTRVSAPYTLSVVPPPPATVQPSKRN
jgi:hypothetical protein